MTQRPDNTTPDNANPKRQRVPGVRPSGPGLTTNRALLLGGLALAAVLLFQSVRVVPAGFVGVGFNKLSGQLSTLQEGVHFVVPGIEPVSLAI